MEKNDGRKNGIQRLSARLPRHLRDADHGQRRRNRQRARQPGPSVHTGRPVRQGQRLREPGLQREPGAHPAAPDRREGRRRVSADRLGRGPRGDFGPLDRNHRARRARCHPALQLSRHRGHPERAERRRRLLQQARRDRGRADLLRFRRHHRLLHDLRPDPGGRPGELRPFPLHRPVGDQHDQHQPAPLAVHRRGAAPRRQGRSHRSGRHPDGQTGRLAPRHQARHRRRPGARHDQRHHRRGSRRPRLCRKIHRRLRGPESPRGRLHARAG